MKQKHLLLLVGMIVVLAGLEKSSMQTVVPSCFGDEDCVKPVAEGYCDVEYGCVQGKCYSKDIGCPEQCNVFGDEDRDGLDNCDDPDCWGNPYCHCQYASFNICTRGECYCPPGTKAYWIHTEKENWCQCK